MSTVIQRQEKLLHNTGWDILILLDACRYDFFKKLYPRYLDGRLRKVLSPASHTLEWCEKVFADGRFQDVLYLSANPYINSKIEIGGFNARDKFLRIVDVWKFGWDNNLGTVPPQILSQQLLINVPNHKGRIIAHYMQPHGPYLDPEVRNLGSFPNVFRGGRSLLGKAATKIASLLEERITFPRVIQLLMCLFGSRIGMKIGPVRTVYALKGPKILRKAYSRSLEIVLESITQLFCRGIFEGKKVVITSDHGELLGEGGFSHLPGSRNPKLIKIPWLEVD